MKKAILFLTFNRLDTTKRVFSKIREAMPPRLYLASDGPRDFKEGEEEVVQQVRDFILNNIDWKCDVKTLFRSKNLGCGRAVSEAIGWFFDNEKDGIILEDDCLPEQSFFKFCEELLDYYAENKRIMHISGDQFVENYESEYSYYFAKVQHCWGWASWSDRWSKYIFDSKKFDEKIIRNFSDDENVQKYWLDVLNRLKNGEIDTWDYQWTFSIISNDGLCINPSKNLISNIGFGGEGTHTFDENNPLANLPVYKLEKIIHPPKIEIDKKAVDWIFYNHYGIKKDSQKLCFFKKWLNFIKI